MLTSRNVHDADSADMMDLMFANRIYEMSFYFNTFSFFDLFKTATNDNADTFTSNYTAQAKTFDRRLTSLLRKLENNK